MRRWRTVIIETYFRIEETGDPLDAEEDPRPPEYGSGIPWGTTQSQRGDGTGLGYLVFRTEAIYAKVRE